MKYTSVSKFTNVIRMIVEALYRLVAGDNAFYDTKDFPWIKDFERNYQLIKNELLHVLSNQEPIPDWQTISNDPSVKIGNAWKVFIFKAYVNKIEKNYSLCPFTGSLIDKYPQITTAWFSILEPQQVIPLHRGPYNGVLRYHLGLLVPEDATQCGIKVKDEIRHWEEGKSLLFDDTHLHTAWNHSNYIRVVLFMDVIRPLPFPFNLINKLIIRFIQYSTYTQNVVKQVRR